MLRAIRIAAFGFSLLTAYADNVMGASVGAGTAGTVGSAGYWKFSAYGDGYWHAQAVDPYAWAELSTDNFTSAITMVGGVWKNFQDNLRIKGGGGLITGKFKDTGDSSHSLLIETGIEKFIQHSILGAEYQLTSGSIVAPSVLRSTEQQIQSRDRGQAIGTSTPSPQHFIYNELSGYAKFLVGRDTLGIRMSVGLPDYARSIFDETLSLKIPIWKSLFVTPAITTEQGPASNIYFSLGLYYLFR